MRHEVVVDPVFYFAQIGKVFMERPIADTARHFVFARRSIIFRTFAINQ